ncbi:ATP-dependent RNA helicase DDX51 [Nothoprocta perdicaria]|uniref:ATP-dependent RNA helicase DDX51 n=1 Tax=Nothoprocta perdicaria TaxID=30464 RepID=UPI000E1BD862|nr:ATP-dependent RNA helicase DDX51 [Nothoprocta perdicaria]
MALFCINRYGGEEPGASEERSRALLQRLREQAKARELRKRQQEAPPPPQRGESGGGAGTAAASGSRAAARKRKREREEAAGGRGAPGARAGPEAAAGPAAKQRSFIFFIVQTPVSQEADDQQENRSNLGNKSHKRKKKDEETKGAEKIKENGESAEGDQNRKEELSIAALEEETKPPPSSLVFLGDYDQKPVQKVQPFLPQWLAQPKLVQKRIKENLVPITDVPGIHPKLLKKLQMNGIESFFPVQAEVIPAILRSASNGYLMGQGGYRPKDICVSAPTGSGKTLSFVIPVVQALLDRVVCQVRALVVLPTKELAQQVSKVFNIYTDGTGLKVVSLAGQKSFAKEQEMLVQKKVTGYCSLADIIVATPGRLADHISQTPGFSLAQLRFLIIDEADRMIDDMHQNWLNQVVKAAFQADDNSGSNRLFHRTPPGPVTAASSWHPQIPLQKLLFSATLTQDPEKLQQLGLFQPRLFTSVYSEKKLPGGGAETEQDPDEKYTLPEGLSQCYVPCNLNSKPLLLLHFMLKMKFSRVLCFTNSKEASHRLFLLIRAFGGVTVAEFSSRLPPNERHRTMKEFEQGKIQLLISTDATARGIDIKGVNCIINYDTPQFIRTYIHRVGRTARAGKTGLAFSMVLRIQERRFLQMLKDAGITDIKQHLVKGKLLKPLVQQYEEALSKLEKTVKDERAQRRA